MVTANQIINPETKRHLVNILYDKGLHLKPAVKICQDEQEAKNFIYKKYSFAVRTALTRFAKQQLYIANKYPSMKGNSVKIHAAEAIISEMQHHQVAPLEVVAAAVYWLKPCIQDIAPAETSRYYAHYKEYIEPLNEWAFRFSKKVRADQLDREMKTAKRN